MHPLQGTELQSPADKTLFMLFVQETFLNIDRITIYHLNKLDLLLHQVQAHICLL